MKAAVIVCLALTLNAQLLTPNRLPKQTPLKNNNSPVSVTTSCNKVDTTKFKVKLPSTQSVFAGYLNVAAGSKSVKTYSSLFQGLSYIFYGSQKATTLAEIAKQPTVIWLNGGPGSSSQIGNFEELGPIRINSVGEHSLNPHSWDTEYNVMFVDQPISVGYGQAADTSEIPTDQDMVGQQFKYALMQFLTAQTGCVKSYTDLEGLLTSPWFIFGESYAGKYVPSIAQAILQTPNNPIPLKGIGIGDAFTDPLTITQQVPGFSFNMGLIDYQERQIAEKWALQATLNINRGNYLGGANDFGGLLDFVVKQSGNVNVYDIFVFGDYEDELVGDYLDQASTKQMFGFNTDYPYNFFSSAVYEALAVDFMKSDCIARLEYVLTEIPVIIYNGQNDLIVPTPGTLTWAYKLNHSAKEQFQNTDFSLWSEHKGGVTSIYGYVTSIHLRYKKSAGNLELRTVNRAGHLVPMDQPVAALNLITSFVEKHRA